jgi:hypothetical protein
VSGAALAAGEERAEVEGGDAERAADARPGAAEGERELPGKLVRRRAVRQFSDGISRRDERAIRRAVS